MSSDKYDVSYLTTQSLLHNATFSSIMDLDMILRFWYVLQKKNNKNMGLFY